MTTLKTSSFRAAPELHALIHATARAVRSGAFADALRDLLARHAASSEPAQVMSAPDWGVELAAVHARLDAIEADILRRVADALHLVEEPSHHAGAAKMIRRNAIRNAARNTSVVTSWTVESGKVRRLTAAGRAELYRLARAGKSRSDIARTLGITLPAVVYRLENPPRRGRRAHHVERTAAASSSEEDPGNAVSTAAAAAGPCKGANLVI